MAKQFAKKLYNSKAWQACRKSYISKRMMIDGGLCERCKQNPGYIVHHKIILTPSNINNPDISLNHENLMYECKECHDNEEGHYNDSKGIKKLKCLFDSNGQPTAP